MCLEGSPPEISFRCCSSAAYFLLDSVLKWLSGPAPSWLSKQAPEALCLHLPCLGCRCHLACPASLWVLGIQTQVLVLPHSPLHLSSTFLLFSSVFYLLDASYFPPLPEGLAVLFFSINLCWAVTKNKFSLKKIIFLRNKLDANRTIIIVFK